MTQEDYTDHYWKVSENDLIGGWCIQPDGEKRPSDGGVMIGDFWTKELAEHAVKLHNDWVTTAVDRDKQALDLKPSELRFRVAVKQRRFGWTSVLLGTDSLDIQPMTFIRLSRATAIEAAVRAGERRFKVARGEEVLVLDADL